MTSSNDSAQTRIERLICRMVDAAREEGCGYVETMQAAKAVFYASLYSLEDNQREIAIEMLGSLQDAIGA